MRSEFHRRELSMRAVQYVRMSTELQRYSIDAQKAAIGEYATAHGYEIVRTYADPGKSGLSLKGRLGLQMLLADVLAPDRDFDTILVLDVGRWGRFQDPDQAGHYEFICRQAGIRILYCAEPFPTGPTNPITAIIKNLKRVMASEYSRDLSERIANAKLAQARRGYQQGGVPIYGLRRQLVDENDIPKLLLKHGEGKALLTDRIRIVAGPAKEQAIVKRIFKLYVARKFGLVAIARTLNDECIPGNLDRPWSFRMVRNVLTCELFIGCYTYNKSTQKLQSPPRRNPERLWQHTSGVLEPLIDKTIFTKAKRRLRERRPGNYTKAQILDKLRAFAAVNHRISIQILNRTRHLPSYKTVVRHFGRLSIALEKAGYEQPICISGADRGWSRKSLRTILRRLHDQHGFLTRQLIQDAPNLPSALSICRKIGGLKQIYDFIGRPHGGEEDVKREAIARRVSKRMGRSPPADVQWRWTKKDIRRGLRALLAQHGYLSGPLIDACPDLPVSTTVAKHFGTLLRAYHAAGWRVGKHDLAVMRRTRSNNGMPR